MIKRVLYVSTVICIVLLSSATAQSRIRVVTTIPDFKFIAETIGGEQVDAFSIAAGFQNPHFVDPKPSYITKLSRADMFITVGLDLEIGWVPGLLQSSRNRKVQPGGEGYVDGSLGVPLLQIPTSVSRDRGDIHVYGNPHYWVNPENGAVIAKTIFDALVRLQPENRQLFETNLEQFVKELDRRIVAWKASMQPYEGTRIISYHNQWPYFADFAGLEIVDFLEPKPGIPPTPSQLSKIIKLMSDESIRVIIIAPYYKDNAARLVAGKVDGEVVTLGSSTEAFDGIDTYFDLFEYNVDKLVSALSRLSTHTQ